MTAIKDRHGRKLALTAYGADGAMAGFSAETLEAALRVKRALSGKPELWARAVEKILGLAPVRVELSFWNGKKLLLNTPADLGNFLSDIEGIIIQDQYNVPNLAGKTVIDAGANIGMFSLYALALGAKKIYAFEAVAETFEFFKRNLELNGTPKGIKAACAALGAENGKAEIRFSDRGEGSSTIDCGKDNIVRDINFPFKRTVNVVPLDGLVKGRVDFIKIDVEGYEKNVLLGAAGIIKKYKPVLSLSAYHRPSDRKTLPEVVRGLRGDYKIKLHRFAEHDFYCD